MFLEKSRHVWILAVAVEAGETTCQESLMKYLCLFSLRIIEVARDFPHCNAVAVDLVPMQSPYAVFLDSKSCFYSPCVSQVNASKLQVHHFL